MEALTMQNQESLDAVIKRVCTNPLSTFVPLPSLYSEKFLTKHSAFNFPIQGTLHDFSLLYATNWFPERPKIREMTDMEKRVYDQLKDLAKDLDFKMMYGPSPKPSGDFSRAVREHADTLISFTSPTGRLNKSEPVQMHFPKSPRVKYK
jgi:hypothetical protein